MGKKKGPAQHSVLRSLCLPGWPKYLTEQQADTILRRGRGKKNKPGERTIRTWSVKASSTTKKSNLLPPGRSQWRGGGRRKRGDTS